MQSAVLKPGARRQAVTSPAHLVVEQCAPDGGGLPIVMRPAIDGVNLLEWARLNRDVIRAKLLVAGGVLFRGFGVDSATAFERFIAVVSGESLEYKERSSPRSRVAGNIYTSTDHPPDQTIFFHNENSYQRVWPRKIFFFAHTPASEGGQTPIVDTRRVLASIAPTTRDKFAALGVMYVRNFRCDIGMSWQTAFQTEDRASVEAYCAQARIACEWTASGGLRTRQVRPAIVTHPVTGEALWFNHAAFFHISTLEHLSGQPLAAAFGDELPNNSYYGDGSAIPEHEVAQIRDSYNRHATAFNWETGDVLLLDNMLVAHGRCPYSGPRRILVGMSEPSSQG